MIIIINGEKVKSEQRIVYVSIYGLHNINDQYEIKVGESFEKKKKETIYTLRTAWGAVAGIFPRDRSKRDFFNVDFGKTIHDVRNNMCTY